MRTRIATTLAATMLGIALTGCGGPTASDDGPHPAWPPPPLPARIVHLKNLADAASFGKPSLLDSIGSAIVGATEQRMRRPSSVAVGDDGTVIVSDQKRQGVAIYRLGRGNSRFVDRVNGKHFVSPVGVALTDDGWVVADSVLNKVYEFGRDDRLRRTIDRPDGFGRPAGVAYDPQDRRLYVVDTVRGQLCVFDESGRMVAAHGAPGGDIGQFNRPTHVHVDRLGRVFVTDSLNFRVQVFDRAFNYLFEIGRHGDASGHFGVPKGVSTDSQGHIYVVDSYFGAVQVFDEQGQLLLSFGSIGGGPGQFQVPTGIAIDGRDRVFVCDSHNRRVQMFQYQGGDSP